MKNTTRELLLNHYNNFSLLQPEDIFKFLFQSSFGCEHLVSDKKSVSEYIKREYEKVPAGEPPFSEKLDGAYSRVYLSWLNEGLSPETLARLFCLSGKEEKDGRALLCQKIDTAKKLIANGEIPLCKEDFDEKLRLWQKKDCPAVHHSDEFREAYKPAYRVISDKYAAFIRIFAEVDRLLQRGKVILAVEGGSASGKTTLSQALRNVYDCNIFHADDFFLRPEQRTPERFSEVGGNIDRERFYDEIVCSLVKNEAVTYRPFDCSVQSLGEEITVAPKRLTVVEGVYSTHPYFGRYYDISVFLDIAPDVQKKRIEVRNSPVLARRFFEEWIPLENTYFEKTSIKERSDLIIPVTDNVR